MQGNAAAVALAYCRRCWPVFPCRRDNKQPLVSGGFHAATTDEPQIRWWLRSWPLALIGVPTGKTSGFVVLDVDVKRLDAKGFDTLAELGHAVLRNTPMVHTASGGLHVYFDPAGRKICNTQRDRGSGIGRGLDVRGYGGYVIVPSPGSGYDSDPFANLDILPLAPAPDGSLPDAGAACGCWSPDSSVIWALGLCRRGAGSCLPADHRRTGR
jgi:hypothetical protein